MSGTNKKNQSINKPSTMANGGMSMTVEMASNSKFFFCVKSHVGWGK
jgi:hypothetical protein